MTMTNHGRARPITRQGGTKSSRVERIVVCTKNYHALHSRLYDGMHRFFSSKNIVIMICRNGRHRCVANAKLWSNTLARCGRHQHSVSSLHLPELDFWEKTCAGKCSECSNQSVRIFQSHYDRVQAECSRHALVPDLVSVIGGDHDQSMQKVLHDQPRTRSMGKTTFYILRKSERQVPQLCLLGRT